MRPKKNTTTPVYNDDLPSLIRSSLDDIGAIFEVLTERHKLDPTTKSLCTAGSYLCDSWCCLILAETESADPTAQDPYRLRPPLTNAQKARRDHRLNRMR